MNLVVLSHLEPIVCGTGVSNQWPAKQKHLVRSPFVQIASAWPAWWWAIFYASSLLATSCIAYL